ncbi:hypothetical protein [Lactiplantibacillus mudanjiangensis]
MTRSSCIRNTAEVSSDGADRENIVSPDGFAGLTMWTTFETSGFG